MFLVHSRWNWNLEVLVLYERGKLDCPERILLEQGREPRTNSAHIQRLHLDSNLGQKGYCEKYYNILKIVVSI